MAANKALKDQSPRRALEMLEKYAGVTTERRWEFLYIYGTLLVTIGARAGVNEMNDQELKTALQKIGKGCFVTYFREFANSPLSNAEVAEMLRLDRDYEKNSSRSRTSRARKIISAGRAKDALMIISASRVPPEIAAKAKRLAAGA